jgi:hypothetical protein
MPKLMRRKRKLKLLLALASLAVAAALVAGAGVVASAGSAPAAGRTGPPGAPVGFGAVTAARLSELGIDLHETAARPGRAQAQIVTIARDRLGGRTVREARFADCDVANIEPQIHRPCWALSVDPTGFTSHGPIGSKRLTARYVVALFDDASGEFLLAEVGR